MPPAGVLSPCLSWTRGFGHHDQDISARVDEVTLLALQGRALAEKVRRASWSVFRVMIQNNVPRKEVYLVG